MVKRKRYRFRQGDAIDVEEFHDGRYGGPGTGRAKRAKPTEEQMRAVNAQNKAKRCRQRMLEYWQSQRCRVRRGIYNPLISAFLSA